jgi:hypothetical protein
MAAFTSPFDASWGDIPAWGALLLGLAYVWRGLLGGRARDRGLLLRQIGLLERLEGFRVTVFGLVLVGAGAAILTEARWLLILSLGIGFVEICESSTLIAAWRRG